MSLLLLFHPRVQAGATVESGAMSFSGDAVLTVVGAAVATADVSSAGEALAQQVGSAIAASNVTSEGIAELTGAAASLAAADAESQGTAGVTIDGSSIASGDAFAVGEASLGVASEEIGGVEETPATISLSYGHMTSYIPDWARARRRDEDDEYIADIIKMIAPHIAREVAKRRSL